MEVETTNNFGKTPFSQNRLTEELIDILSAFRSVKERKKQSQTKNIEGVSYPDILKELTSNQYYSFEYEIGKNQREWDKAKRWFNHHLKHLVNGGILKRKSHPDDRRKKLLFEL